ncbi:MAG: PUR family DNA/RNA-binding protein [Bacteroides sp.]
MEDLKKKMSTTDMNDKEIVYSRAIKAGKRIYYLDVKKNRKDEMFLAITESKKVISGEGDESQVSFEKHKIFLYKEDFNKFMAGLNQAIDFIARNNEESIQPESESEATEEAIIEKEETEYSEMSCIGEKIKIDIDFE